MVSDCEQPAKAVIPITIRGCVTRNNSWEFISFCNSSANTDT